jgi:hypothetical protein
MFEPLRGKNGSSYGGGGSNVSLIKNQPATVYVTSCGPSAQLLKDSLLLQLGQTPFTSNGFERENLVVKHWNNSRPIGYRQTSQLID